MTLLSCGVDEAGRGPLAGPVFAAAVILDPDRPIYGLADSKKLGQHRRQVLAEVIKSNSVAYAIASSSVEEIDALNILNAALLAMRRAIISLAVTPDIALVDGNRCPEVSIDCKSIIKGDALEPAISAASILAKTSRDAAMLELDAIFPMYGFRLHKGYDTPQHRLALARYGATPIHRKGFKPVRDLTCHLTEQKLLEGLRHLPS